MSSGVLSLLSHALEPEYSYCFHSGWLYSLLLASGMAVALCPLGIVEEIATTWPTPPPCLVYLGMKVALASACSQIWAAEWPGEECSYIASEAAGPTAEGSPAAAVL